MRMASTRSGDGSSARAARALVGEVCPGASSTSAEAFYVHSRSLNGLPDHLARHDVDYRDAAREAGLADADTGRVDTYVPLGRFARLLEIAAEATGDTCFALRWSTDDDDGNHGPLPLCLRYAPTLRGALETLYKFVSVYIDLDGPRYHDDSVTAGFSWGYSPLIPRCDQLADRNAALFMRWLTAGLPENVRPAEIRLMREQPKSSRLHRELLGSNIVFAAERNELIFHSSSLDLLNPAADRHLYHALWELNIRLLQERRRRDDLVLKVREEVARRMGEGSLTLETVARHLGLSSRALQRRLAANGVSYQELLDASRREAAKRYIEETNLMVSEIAYRLGFSSIGNFTRAAKRWFGQSPREYRNEMQSSGENFRKSGPEMSGHMASQAK